VLPRWRRRRRRRTRGMGFEGQRLLTPALVVQPCLKRTRFKTITFSGLMASQPRNPE
jgi:hypothetical protein